MAVKSTTIFM